MACFRRGVSVFSHYASRIYVFFLNINLCFNVNYFTMAAHHIFENQPKVIMKNLTIF